MVAVQAVQGRLDEPVPLRDRRGSPGLAEQDARRLGDVGLKADGPGARPRPGDPHSAGLARPVQVQAERHGPELPLHGNHAVGLRAE
jgi:hypothetical protein